MNGMNEKKQNITNTTDNAVFRTEQREQRRRLVCEELSNAR